MRKRSLKLEELNKRLLVDDSDGNLYWDQKRLVTGGLSTQEKIALCAIFAGLLTTTVLALANFDNISTNLNSIFYSNVELKG